MEKVSYDLKIGEWQVNSDEELHTEFIELEIVLSLDSISDACQISVYAPSQVQAGMVEGLATEAAGELGFGGEGGGESVSVQVRGNQITYGDPMSIELSVGDVSNKIMTAKVQKIDSSFGLTTITGRTGMQKLATTRLNQIYENQSLSQIVNDLAGLAGVDTGEIETGNTYPYFVVHESKSLLKHIREQAIREGMDVYFDNENSLIMKKFNKSSADHIFRFGKEILDLELFNHQMINEHIFVYGESPSSNQGPDIWHWIAKDISPFQGEAGDSVKLLSIQDSAIRTKDAADTYAASKLGAIMDHSTFGRLKILGNPSIKLADAIEIKDAPKPELNGLFKVTLVRHIVNKQKGYLTHIGFCGIGGAESAAGSLKGAVGF
ncbi:MAG: hypothetical protein KAV87_43690 [Desulfobacteraceae bacterium]|nr:hypothetical protein [Desulfobacteraceae bacterium]